MYSICLNPNFLPIYGHQIHLLLIPWNPSRHPINSMEKSPKKSITSSICSCTLLKSVISHEFNTSLKSTKTYGNPFNPPMEIHSNPLKFPSLKPSILSGQMMKTHLKPNRFGMIPHRKTMKNQGSLSSWTKNYPSNFFGGNPICNWLVPGAQLRWKKAPKSKSFTCEDCQKRCAQRRSMEIMGKSSNFSDRRISPSIFHCYKKGDTHQDIIWKKYINQRHWSFLDVSWGSHREKMVG